MRHDLFQWIIAFLPNVPVLAGLGLNAVWIAEDKFTFRLFLIVLSVNEKTSWVFIILLYHKTGTTYSFLVIKAGLLKRLTSFH